MVVPKQQSPEDRLKAVRQIGFEALSAIDRARNTVLDGQGERTLDAIARANAERVGDEAIDSTLRGEQDTYVKLAAVADRAALLAAEIEAPLLPEGWTVRETIPARIYFYQGGNAQVSINKEADRGAMIIRVWGEQTWAGYVGDDPGYVPLAEALTRAQETLVDPSSHLGPYGVEKVEAAKKKLDVDRADLALKAAESGVKNCEKEDGMENKLEDVLGLANPDATVLHEDLAELVRLTTLHAKLAEMVGEDMNLSYDDDFTSVKEGLRDAIRGHIDKIGGVVDVEFTMDSRFATVILELENNRSNRMSGGWSVPVDDALLAAVDYERDIAPFGECECPEETQAVGYVVMSITETGNAAFVDLGRDQEVARIMDEAAENIQAKKELTFDLWDANGNKVGKVEHAESVPTGEPDEGTVRLSVKTGGSAFEGGTSDEVARILREAADKVRDGESIFVLRDYNGNTVGKFEFREEPSLDKDGVIDMSEALNSGRVYLGEDGFSGIADGEYRYVVTTPDFEPGYGQGEGDVWLVNARGEIAPGYEEPQSVRETLFRELKRDEKSDLWAVAEGRVSFDDFERRFSGEEPELG